MRAVVYDSDIDMNYDPLQASLKSANKGLFADLSTTIRQ